MISQEKLERLWLKLEELGLDGMLSVNCEGITGNSPHAYNPNPLYLTGINATNIWVFLSTRKREISLITDPRYEEAVKGAFTRSEPHIVKSRAELLSTIRGLLPIISESKPRIAVESHTIFHSEAEFLKKEFDKDAELVFLQTFENPITALRRTKSAAETELLQKAQEITADALKEALRILEPGMAELEFAAEIEYRMKRLGAQATGFPSIVASGTNSAIPHARAGSRRFAHGDIVQIDAGAVYNGYHGDLSRVVFIGNPKPELFKILFLVNNAMRKGISLCVPGAKIHDADQGVREFLGEYAKHFSHSLGHGVGLEIHESPRINSAMPDDAVFEQGDVVTIEPGLYFPAEFGMRLEEMVVVGKDGPRILGADRLYPLELIAF